MADYSDSAAPSLSFCTVCKDRLVHLRKTLPRNLKLIRESKVNAEIVIVDWQSSDGLADWITAHFQHEILTQQLRFFELLDEIPFSLPIAKNMAHRLGRHDILVNADVDNFIGELLPAALNLQSGKFLSCDQMGKGAFGRIGMWREDFARLNGYDESFEPAGHHDFDLKKRAELMGLKKVSVSCAELPLPHGKELTMTHLGGGGRSAWAAMERRNAARSRKSRQQGSWRANQTGLTPAILNDRLLDQVTLGSRDFFPLLPDPKKHVPTRPIRPHPWAGALEHWQQILASSASAPKSSLRAVMTLWTGTRRFKMAPGPLLVHTLAVRLASRFFSETQLVTDRRGAEIARQQGWQFSEVSCVLDEAPIQDPGWSAAKMIAITLQDRPFIHLDGDVLFFRPLNPTFSQAPIFAQSWEPEGWYQRDFPSIIAHAGLPMDGRSVNAGILGGQDIQLLHDYARFSLRLFTKFHHQIGDSSVAERICSSHQRKARSRAGLVSADSAVSMVCEQYALDTFCQQRGVAIEFLIPWRTELKELRKQGYAHLQGGSKLDKWYLEFIPDCLNNL